MGNVNLLDALMGIHVDAADFEAGLKNVENRAEESTKAIAGKFNLMAVGIATAIVGTVIVALEKAIHTTAEWGLEMEHLANRMGMTTTQAATLVGVLERFGISGGVAARSMQIMAMEAKQTTDSLDPFATKMGRVLGTLRDTSGHALNLAQVLDLARQKVSAATSETEKLQIAQSLVGARMAGQLLPVLKLSNDEWERQKASVEKAIGPVDQAAKAALDYKQATAQLEQEFRGLEITLGSKILPVLSSIIETVSKTIDYFKDFSTVHPIIASLLNPLKQIGEAWDTMKLTAEAFTYAVLQGAEALGLVDKGTAANFAAMEQQEEAAKETARAHEKTAEAVNEEGDSLEKSVKLENQLVQIAQQRLHLAEEAKKYGIGDQAGIELAAQERLVQLAEKRAQIVEHMNSTGINADQMKKLREDLAKVDVEAAQTTAKVAEDQYKSEELAIKAAGAFNLNNEIQLLEKKLSDERTVGEERLKIEGEIYTKRKQLAEETMKVARDLGFASVDQEIAYRKQKAAELLGKGDVVEAGKEAIQVRDLAIKQGEAQMEFAKKLHVVSIQDEIAFQTQKLALVKGNAEEEMKVIGQIADLDKQLYEKRLTFGLNYTHGIMDALKQLQDAQAKADAGKGGEEMTFERARAEADRQLPQVTRALTQTAEHGGTEEQRSSAVAQAQKIQETFKIMEETGKDISQDWREAEKAAEQLLKAASGGEEVRAPGGPSPTVGSITSSQEGLASNGLARGSDIPRLDTSFTDLATRLRDVLNTNVLNLNNFGLAVGNVVSKLNTMFGGTFNPGAVAPGGQIVGAGVPGQPPNAGGGTATTPPPTIGPGGAGQVPQPTTQTGIGGAGTSDVVTAIQALTEAVKASNADLAQKVNDNNTANQEQLAAALDRFQQGQADASTRAVTVSVDPSNGNLITAVEQALAP